MNTFFPETRVRLAHYLETHFQHKVSLFAYLKPTGAEAFTTLSDFAVGGKMLRGAMSLLVYEMISGKKSESMVPMGAAIEMLGSVLLIHDDIIDRDRLRRGKASVYAQYEKKGEERQYLDPAHFGISMGICIGDLGLFALQDMLCELPVPAERVVKLFQLLAREAQVTGVAEMIDTERAMQATTVTIADIEKLYIAKTARYTFCLPLLAGAIAAGASDGMQKMLDQLGEVMGLLYQIKDDQLGLFGTAEEIGKAADSDVREGKRTLYYVHVMELATPAQRLKLETIFGNPKLTPTMLKFVQDTVISSGAKSRVDVRLTELEDQARQLISSLDLSSSHRQTLQHFLDYNLLRKR